MVIIPRLQFNYGRRQPGAISKLCRFTTTDRQSSSTLHLPFAKPQVGRLRHWRKRRRGRPSRNHRSKPAFFWGDGAGRLVVGTDNGAGSAREPRYRAAGPARAQTAGAWVRGGRVGRGARLAPRAARGRRRRRRRKFFRKCPCIAVRVPV